MNKQRLAGIEKEMSRVISSLLLQEVKNPVLKKAIVSISSIRVTEDLKFADVYFTVSSLNGTTVNVQGIEEALNQVKGFFRKKVAENLGLRYTPEIRIKMDNSIEQAIKITELLNEIKGQ